jgi:predicted ester cyclase
MTDRADSERYMNIARRWFAEGWAGNVALADDLFSENVRTNGVLVGVAGHKRGIQRRLAAFPDLTTTIEDMFSAYDKIVTRHVWRGTHRGSYGGVKATGKPVEVRETLLFGVSKTARWRKCPQYRISSGF